MKMLKVWGIGLYTNKGSHVHMRVIVCASTKKKAIEYINASKAGPITYRFLSEYGSLTGNDIELATAIKEGDVFWKPNDDYHAPYERAN